MRFAPFRSCPDSILAKPVTKALSCGGLPRRLVSKDEGESDAASSSDVCVGDGLWCYDGGGYGAGPGRWRSSGERTGSGGAAQLCCSQEKHFEVGRRDAGGKLLVQA